MGKGLWRYEVAILAVAGAFALGMLIDKLDRPAAEATAKHVQAAAERKADIKPEDRIALSHPLQGLWVEHCNAQQGCKRRYTPVETK